MTMRGFSNWDGQLSISSSPSLPHSRNGALDNSRKLSKSRSTPAHASYSSTTIISPRQSNEQESDCCIIDPKPQKICGPRIHTRASIEMKRISSVDTLPTVYQSFHPPVLDPQIQHMYEPSVTDNTLTDHSHFAAQHNSHRMPTSRPSVGFSSLRNCDTPILPHPKPLPSPDTVIELDDDGEEVTSKHDVIEISSDSDIADHNNEDEEMVVDDMLTQRVSISSELSSPSPSEMGGSLFTPPPSCKRRRRFILDHVAVPSFPMGLTTANYKPSSDAHSSAPQQGVEHPSVGDALAAAFAQNERSSPSLDRKGKRRERERETTPTVPVPPKIKMKRVQKRFAEGVPTTATTILNAYFPPVELEIPDFLPCLDDTWHRNTYWLERLRFKRHHAELYQNLPEMIAQMKSLGGPGNEQEDSPILPRVLAPLLERRPDIAASLGAQWDYASKHYRKSKSTKLLETKDIPSSSNSDPVSFPFANCDVDLNMEMDEYFNDLGDSLTKWQPPGTKDVRAPHLQSSPNAYSSASHLNGFLHHTNDAPFGGRNDAVDGFLGVPPSPKHDHNLSSPIQYTDTYLVDHSQTMDDSFEHVFPKEGTWSGLPDVLEQEVVSSVSLPDSAGTIDPSLLGGNEPPPKPLPSPVIPTQIPKQLPSGPIIYVRRPPGVSALQEAPAQGTMLGKSRRNIQIKYRMSGSTSPMDEDDVVPNKNVTNVAGSTAEAVNSRPARSVARPSLKIRIRRSSTRASSNGSFVPSQASTSASPFVPSTPLSGTRCSLDQEPTPAPTLQKDKSEILESSFCHHCRRTTTKPKMQCSKRRQDRQICGKLFCDRCIMHRYPELTFVRLSKTFVCPVCTNTCNCSQCARKRGEEYISMRGGGFAGSRTKSGIVLVPDADQAQDIQTMPQPPASAPQTMFWAHVYGLEGERVGRAFIGDATAPRMQPAKQLAPKGLSKSKRTAKKPKLTPIPIPEAKPKEKNPRVFIGMPLSEWKVRSFRDLEPSAPIPPLVAEEENHAGKGKGKAVERPRVFIGDARWLHVPYARMPASPQSSRASSPAPESGGEQGLELDSDGSLTPLDDLEEAMDWPQPGVGEAVTVTWRESACERSVSTPLSPDDVEKAIGFALAVTL